MKTRIGYFFKAISGFGLGGWIALGSMFIGFAGIFIFIPPFIGIPVGLFCVLLFWLAMFKGMTESERLNDIGIEADARILSVMENGASLQMGGALPKAGIDLALEVRPKDRAPYQTRIRTFISVFDMQNFQPWRVVKVKYDPKNPKNAVLSETTGPMELFSSDASVMRSVADAEALGRKILADQQGLFSNGKELPAQILSVTSLNVFVNGDNPLMQFTLEVQDPSGVYEATVTAPISQASIPKFIAGKKVVVKVDPENKAHLVLLKAQ